MMELEYIKLGQMYHLLTLRDGSHVLYGSPKVEVTVSDLLRAEGKSGYADDGPRRRCGLDVFRENQEKR